MPASATSSHTPARRSARRADGRRRLALAVAVFTMLGSVALAIAVDEPRTAFDARGQIPQGAVIVGLQGAAADASAGQLGASLPEVRANLTTRVQRVRAAGAAAVPALQLTAVRATAEPGPDGLYRVRENAATIRGYLELARQMGAPLILDIRPGRARWIDELRALRPFLAEPDVGVSLDPEWKVGPSGVPGGAIGAIDAGTINALAGYVGAIALEGGLPDKLVVVHQFAPRMITDRDAIASRAGTRLIIDLNGRGTPAEKRRGYTELTRPDGAWEWGISVFPQAEPGALTPAELIELEPAPALVLYG